MFDEKYLEQLVKQSARGKEVFCLVCKRNFDPNDRYAQGQHYNYHVRAFKKLRKHKR